MKWTKYRIRRGSNGYYYPQYKPWYWPFCWFNFTWENPANDSQYFTACRRSHEGATLWIEKHTGPDPHPDIY